MDSEDAKSCAGRRENCNKVGQVMRSIVYSVWCLVPVMVGAYHFGPGQERLVLDSAATLLQEAGAHAEAEEWAAAEGKYEQALALLPASELATARRARLERAKAQMFIKELPRAHASLKSLVDELEQDAGVDHGMLADARSALANSQYYMTWLMRLEGQPRDRWEPEIESARQTYRLLAQNAEAMGDQQASLKNRQDLESVIRLARMEISDLQGLPIPSQ